MDKKDLKDEKLLYNVRETAAVLEVYSYLLQGAILAVFIIIEIAMAASNKYITKVQTQEQGSIEVFKGIIQQLEICRVQITDEVNRKEIDKVLEKMRYSDPVSSPAVATENETIRQLILQLSSTTDEAAFAEICGAIMKQLEIRKIKNTKEQG